MDRYRGAEDGATGGYAYSPYGEMEEGYTEGGTPFLFQGDYLDPDTSLYMMEARWYDPSSSFFSHEKEIQEASGVDVSWTCQAYEEMVSENFGNPPHGVCSRKGVCPS